MLTDQQARRRIAEETSSNLFVDAGAGSGKTHSLITRVTTLVMRDGVRLANIAAVTFTEKAGAELRDRLRAEFEVLWRANESEEQRTRAADALDDLDSAAIGTLHSFAQRILGLHPIEAGLPPLLEVLDEVASSVAFEERWTGLQRELLDDPEMSERVVLALGAGVKLDHLRSIARAFGADWDLIEDRVLPGGPPTLPTPEVAHLAEQAARLAARASECTDTEDKFLPDLAALGEWGERLTRSSGDREVYGALLDAQDLRFRYGSKSSWPRGLPELKDACKDLQQQAATAAAAFTEATLRPLAYWIADRVVRSARQRAAEGRLEFHDLLVLARELLRENAEVRAALRDRFQRLLLDEFQDTDPIQIELAVRIAGGRDADAADWRDVEVPPGSLFVVGDPKQSIYRFRRANIGTYLGAQEWFGDAAQVGLTTNFRTCADILDWVNGVFAELIQPKENAQPVYEALDPDVMECGSGPAVAVLGAEKHEYAAHGGADRLRHDEAADVAAVIRKAVQEGWTVRDPGSGEWRPIRLGDIAVLIPARTSLDQLEEALDRSAIAYRAESSSLVYQAPEVHHLMLAARAVADPGDLYSCVMALRSPLFGCGDDDLWTWKRDGGSFNILAPFAGDRADHPVAQAIDYLRRLHYQSRWMTPSEVLGALVADRRMLEVAVDGPRTRDQWRRLRFVVDQARAWSEVEHGGLRSYLLWAAKQGEESSRVAEAILPETDVDAVRILTIHGAKGLEFPMVVLSGMSSKPRAERGVQLLWKPDGYAVKLTQTMQTNDFKDVQPLDEQMDAHERRRLLYVGATRARDHLVVSLHRGQAKEESGTNAELLAAAGAAEVEGVVTLDDLTLHSPAASSGGGSLPPPPELQAWKEHLESVRAATRRLPAQSASGLEGTEPDVVLDPDQILVAGLHKGARDVELPPWKKGRYGDAIGRAVHGVLQVVDLETGAGLDDAVAAQCTAEGVSEHASHVRALVRSALAHEVVRRAATRPHWRESYVGMVEEDGTVLEGFVDLIYREDDGTLMVVDYKTDDIPPDALKARSAFYAPQVQAYKELLEASTSATVNSRILFVTASAT